MTYLERVQCRVQYANMFVVLCGNRGGSLAPFLEKWIQSLNKKLYSESHWLSSGVDNTSVLLDFTESLKLPTKKILSVALNLGKK